MNTSTLLRQYKPPITFEGTAPASQVQGRWHALLFTTDGAGFVYINDPAQPGGNVPFDCSVFTAGMTFYADIRTLELQPDCVVVAYPF